LFSHHKENTTMKKTRMLVGVMGLATLGSACVNRADDTVKTSSALTASPAVTATPPVPGYSHAFERSLFKPGGTLTTASEMGITKIIGSNGVFATDQVNGWVLATPNAGAPSTTRPPLPGAASDHNAKVLAYFVAAGIPQDQIGSVSTHTLMRGGASAAGVRDPDQFEGFYSILNRAINGVVVSESTAWARFNTDGEVVEESVYWPPLPASVVQDATALAAKVADPAFTSVLTQIEAHDPGYGIVDGQVVIHHNDATSHAAPYAVATYDSLPSRGGRGIKHFDGSGVRIFIAAEVASH
jgi:hypothetical protein